MAGAACILEDAYHVDEQGLVSFKGYVVAYSVCYFKLHAFVIELTYLDFNKLLSP